MNDNWLDKVHDRMADYETEEPAGLWESIESSRMETSGSKTAEKNTDIKMRIVRISVAAAILAVLFTASFYLLTRPEENLEAMRLTAVNGNDISVPVNDHNQMLASVYQDRNPTPVTANERKTENKEDQSQNLPEKIEDNKALSETNSANSERETENVEGPIQKITKKTGRSEYTDKNGRAPRFTKKHSDSDRLAFSLYSSTGTGSAFGNRSPQYMFVGSVGANNYEMENNPMLGVLAYNQGQGIETKVKHRLPIRTGISFSYRINYRFDIESGLTYTNLTSEITEGSENHYLESEQKLHYIGIPLNLKYHIFSWKRLELYTSAGVLAEKCVSASLDKEYILNNQEINSESEEITEKPMQWSVNMSVGMECKLTHSIGVFAEPGLSYYIDDGSSLQTIYKDKPLNFNLNLGLRFSFGK